jgi:glutamate/tyrosine decarboxylase-like PLP-dependent enzyme
VSQPKDVTVATDTALEPERWDDLRRLAHRMVDDVIDGFRTIRDRPVWQPVPASARAHLRGPLPVEPIGAEAAYDHFREFVSPYPRGNTHPRFWGWVNGSGLPVGVLSELLAAAMNPSVGVFENAATLVEEQVLAWLKEMLGFPATVSAILTSGCSMSNIIALAVARSAGMPVDVRRAGVAALPKPLALYASREAHSSIRKAVELLGLGSNALHGVDMDGEYRIDVDALERAIRADRDRGLQPFCVVANAGTVNTGAIDDIDGLADLCARERLWLHVDGAFGALGWLCPELRASLAGLQRADSLAFDLHKWMYLPNDVGCVFVKDAAAHRDAFVSAPSYLAQPDREDACGTKFADYGIELTRRFRALKVWTGLKAHGVSGFERQIRANLRQAAYLAARVEQQPDLELAAPVSLNVICFRYVAPLVSEEGLNAINQAILNRLQAGGVVFVSHTTLGGRFVLRAAVTNHRSREEDLDVLVDTVVRIGAEVACVGHG